jgi:hypothetical protein
LQLVQKITTKLSIKDKFQLELNVRQKKIVGRLVVFIGEKSKIFNFLNQFHFFNHELKEQLSLKSKISTENEALKLLELEQNKINKADSKLCMDKFKLSLEQERIELKLKHGLKAEFSSQPYLKGESKEILRPKFHGIHVPVSFFNIPTLDPSKFRF